MTKHLNLTERYNCHL